MALNFWENLSTAFASLISSKLRALLTMLGIIIGISSVILMSSLGAGGQDKITGDMKRTGYGNFKITIDQENSAYRDKYALDSSDVQALLESGEFEAVSGIYTNRMSIKYEDKSSRISLSATNPSYEKISEINYLQGRDFLPIEYEDYGNYIVIDNLTAQNLFGTESPIGKTVSLSTFGSNSRTFNFYVLGTFENPMATMFSIMSGGRFFPSFSRIPTLTAERLFNIKEFSAIEIKTRDTEKIDEAMYIAKTILEERNISDIYEINMSTNNTSSFDSILSTLTIFITAVASISLLVGGIGVMNIMLVSVTERIKEIGIRKALGATNGEILAQFMVEAIILTITGGILGILLGVSGAYAIGKFIDITPIFTQQMILLSVSISTAIGLIFGVVPARKASLLDPIEALHNE